MSINIALNCVNLYSFLFQGSINIALVSFIFVYKFCNIYCTFFGIFECFGCFLGMYIVFDLVLDSHSDKPIRLYNASATYVAVE